MMVLIGDFNAKCTNWYKHDKTNFEGIAKENIPWQCGFYQVINKPTHILESFAPCIDLIFTFHSNLITELRVHPSLHSNCHHQAIYAKFNLKIHHPPPFEGKVWHYSLVRNRLPPPLNFFLKKNRTSPLLLGLPRLLILYIFCYENFLFMPNFENFKMRRFTFSEM